MKQTTTDKAKTDSAPKFEAHEQNAITDRIQNQFAVTDPRTVAGKKAIVRASQDRQWPKWCVIYPDRATRWFDSESQALLASDAYNGESYL